MHIRYVARCTFHIRIFILYSFYKIFFFIFFVYFIIIPLLRRTWALIVSYTGYLRPNAGHGLTTNSHTRYYVRAIVRFVLTTNLYAGKPFAGANPSPVLAIDGDKSFHINKHYFFVRLSPAQTVETTSVCYTIADCNVYCTQLGVLIDPSNGFMTKTIFTRRQ